MKSSVVEPYWPHLPEGLEWVCDACGRYMSSTHGDLKWLPEDRVPPAPPNRGFWRVEILCASAGCTSTIVAHTQTFGRTSQRNLGLIIGKATPTPVCGLGHAIVLEHSYPERVDFIEWSGPDDYFC